MATVVQQALKIRRTNLYALGYILDFPSEGESVLLRDIQTFEATDGDQFHSMISNERLDLIAYQYYGDQIERATELWWVIADANGIMNPLDLRNFVGKELRIPNIQSVLVLL